MESKVVENYIFIEKNVKYHQSSRNEGMMYKMKYNEMEKSD